MIQTRDKQEIKTRHIHIHHDKDNNKFLFYLPPRREIHKHNTNIQNETRKRTAYYRRSRQDARRYKCY